MENLAKDPPDETSPFFLKWDENSAVKDLLNTLVSILSDEYIQKAKNHPEIFSK